MPHQDDIDKVMEQKYNEKYSTSEGAVVDYFSAIALVNRYCASLPCDIFTRPAIEWSAVPKQTFMVSIFLPIQSPCRDEIRVSLSSKIDLFQGYSTPLMARKKFSWKNSITCYLKQFIFGTICL